MTKEELDDWSGSLRFRIEGSSMIVGTIYGVVILLIFGPMVSGRGGSFFHLIISIFGPSILSLLVYQNIWVRQLTLPGALGGAIYSCAKFHGQDLYLYLNLCCLIVVTRIAMGLIEAHATTGKYADLWRSFLYHPLDWAKYFGIKTRLE